MNKGIKGLLLGSVVLGVTAGFYTMKKEKSKAKVVIKKEEINSDFSKRTYHKVADIYQDENNNIKLRKVI